MNLDHVAYAGGPWEKWFDGARNELSVEGLNAVIEGPPVHHPDYKTPTIEEQIAALKAAGFDDPQVVWRRFDTVLIMARKR